MFLNIKYHDAPKEGDVEINNFVTVKSGENTVELSTKKLTLYVLSGTIQLGRSKLARFGLNQGFYEGLVCELQNALLFLSQELTREISEGSAKVNGIEISKLILLRNY